MTEPNRGKHLFITWANCNDEEETVTPLSRFDLYIPRGSKNIRAVNIWNNNELLGKVLETGFTFESSFTDDSYDDMGDNLQLTKMISLPPQLHAISRLNKKTEAVYIQDCINSDVLPNDYLVQLPTK
jgi:hypothetical protein